MSTYLTDDIREQEESIFEELDNLKPDDELIMKRVHESARSKARQQLAISPDSPFSHIQAAIDLNEFDRVRYERAGALREETNEIRRQLDLVKSRLEDLKGQQQNESDKNETFKASLHHNRASSIDSKQSGPTKSTQVHKSKRTSPQQAKFRPLTGQADCPNCNCDRRNSVCNQCIGLALIKPVAKIRNSLPMKVNEPKRVSYEDERPIRPAKDRAPAGSIGNTANVDDLVVPSRVYTISKSLNEKRTKLAQAINDLQLMMDQVKERESKLERERKVVQLYKNQWKYGPSIGGPSASSRERLGGFGQRRHYQSRMDPNLSRDIRSVMGFQHIEPSLKLREYPSPPKPAPRGGSNFKPSINARSKSLESLRQPQKRDSGMKSAIANFENGKPSSEINLNSESAVEEQIEDEIKIDDREDEEEDATHDKEPAASSKSAPMSENIDLSEGAKPEQESGDSKERIDQQTKTKTTWIPVFGETEVKTVKRAPTKRKIQIVTPGETPPSPVVKHKPSQAATVSKPSNLKQSSFSPRTTSGNTSVKQAEMRTQVRGQVGSSSVMVEAERRLRVASNLLEQEHRDSSTKNQLVINKPMPLPRQSTFSRSGSPTKRDKDPSSRAATISDPLKEIERLEEMVREQQQLVSRLTQAQEQHRVLSPVVVSSPCCHHSSPCQHSSLDKHCPVSPTSGGKKLIYNLRDRLNRTKTRLARTLEEEREKHQRLQMQVDSSLRKQSDLENENELLKKSLSKCIDTCLKDISSTFESLSDTLDDSMTSLSKHQSAEVDDDNQSTSSGSMLTNAAQLISDNRHLKQMQSHIQNIERQRRGIFDELNKEKQRTSQLESQLRESQSELDELNAVRRKLESQLNSVIRGQSNESNQNQGRVADLPVGTSQPETSVKIIENLDSQVPSTSAAHRVELGDVKESDKSDLDDSYNCVDLYRRYIQSISPDIESLRRERELILGEFDNIKKMLSDNYK